MSKFKKGDKIRIKDEVSYLTHREQFPHFAKEMDDLKDKVLTISGFTKQGFINVEKSGYDLHPDWVTLAESINFKKGDKIRIKDEVSSKTHRYEPPHFIDSMDELKDKVLTIRGFTSLGYIEVENFRYNLHPDWVTLVYGGNFKKGDKIRIKDEVSSKTHRYEPPHFIDSMDRFKDEVLTIKDFTKQGNIEVEGYEFCLNPEWVTLAESEPGDDFVRSVLDGIFKLDEIFNQISEELTDYDSILEEAQDILEGDRESDYGDPVANFNRISHIASSILNEDITPEQCVVVMMAVKLSREQYRHKRDNLVDLVAYIEIYNRIKEQH